MVNYEYNDHLLIIEKERGSEVRKMTILILKPTRKIVATLSGLHTLRQAKHRAERYVDSYKFKAPEDEKEA